VIGALIGGVTNVIFNAGEIDNFWEGLGYFGIGAAAGALGAGIGAGVSSALASGGSFGAGFIGTSNVVSTGFASGFVSGASSGFSSSFVLGFGNAAMDPNNNFNDMILEGLDLGWKGAIGGAVWGGVAGGIDAIKNDRNFWTGADKQYGALTLKTNGNKTEWKFEPVENIENSSQEFVEKHYWTDLNEVSELNSDGSRYIKMPKSFYEGGAIKLRENAFTLVHELDNTFTYIPGSYNRALFFGYRWTHQPLTKIRYLFNDRLVTSWKDYFIFW
jgi:hypothetical protein